MNSSTRAWLFLSILAVALLVLGHSLAGREGILWAVVISLSINSIIYFYGDFRINSLFGGRELEGQDPWGLLEMTHRLAQKARIPEPRVIVVAKDAPQAVVTGRSIKHGTIFVTEGLLDSFSRKEIEAVIAYQIACIHNHDTLIYNVASVFSGAVLTITGLLDSLVRGITGAKKNSASTPSHLFTYLMAPVASFVLRLALGSSSYYASDQLAASYLEDPKVLAEVLWKLQSYATTQPIRIPASMAHLFIVNPLTAGGWTRYFQAQPSVERRIKKLIGYYPI